MRAASSHLGDAALAPDENPTGNEAAAPVTRQTRPVPRDRRCPAGPQEAGAGEHTDGTPGMSNGMGAGAAASAPQAPYRIALRAARLRSAPSRVRAG